MDFLCKTTFLQLFDGLAHRAAAGSVAGHQLGFGRQAGTTGQAFSGNAGKQIGVDLIVFGHDEGSMPIGLGARNLKGWREGSASPRKKIH